MAHSHQNTLLSRLGFSDPDRSDPKHTLACEYLCKPEIAAKIVTAVGRSGKRCEKPEPVECKCGYAPDVGLWIGEIWAQTETPIMNGNFYIGFTDVIVYYNEDRWQPHGEYVGRRFGDNGKYLGEYWRYEYRVTNSTQSVLVEVKTKRCDPADIVKQIKLYQQYRPTRDVVVATCYPVSQSTKDMLKREGIHHIFLGAGFEAYCAERRAEKPVSEEGL